MCRKVCYTPECVYIAAIEYAIHAFDSVGVRRAASAHAFCCVRFLVGKKCVRKGGTARKREKDQRTFLIFPFEFSSHLYVRFPAGEFRMVGKATTT